MSIEITLPCTVVSKEEYTTSKNNTTPIVPIDNKISVEVKKNTFSIVGDVLYTSVNQTNTPPWLSSILDTTITNIINPTKATLDTANSNIIDAFSALETAKNTYSSIVDIKADFESVVASKYDTLNATINNNDATYKDLIATKVTPEEATTIAINQISSSVNGGLIGSEITRLDTVTSDINGSLANLVTSVDTKFTDVEKSISVNSNYIESVAGYAGYDPSATTNLNDRLQIIEKQNDGVIETYAGTKDVILNGDNKTLAKLVTTAEPYATWLAEDSANGTIDTRLAHIGDIYIKYTLDANNNKNYIASYKFIKTTPDITDSYSSTDADGFTWALIVDQASQIAFTQSLNAYDLADNKRRVFVDTVAPTGPYDAGDIWLTTSESSIVGITIGTRKIEAGDILRATKSNTTYNYLDWTPADSYRDAIIATQKALDKFIANEYSTYATNMKSQIDQKSISYYQETDPHPSGTATEKASWIGDLWKKPSNNREYVYTFNENTNTYYWKELDAPDFLYDVIDTKKSIYVSDTEPTVTPPDVLQDNDMWIPGTDVYDSSGKLKYAKGELYLYSSAANSWYKATSYADTLQDTATQLKNQIDKKIDTWFNDSTSDPSSTWTLEEKAIHIGDLWYKKDLNKLYYYDNTYNWVETRDKDALNALDAANTAQATADSKVTTYYTSNSNKVLNAKEGDIWFNPTGDTFTGPNGTVYPRETTKVKQADGSWKDVTKNAYLAFEHAIKTLSINLDNETNERINADTTVKNTLTGKINDGIATVEAKWAYNSNIKIDGKYYSSGFGIDINASSGGNGTETSPYTSEFWVDATKFKVVDPTGNIKALGDYATKNLSDNLIFSADTSGITFNNKGSIKSANYSLLNRKGIYIGYSAGFQKMLVGNGTNYIYYSGNSIDMKVQEFNLVDGIFNVQNTEATGEKTVIDNRGIRIYDSSGILRVKVGL